ncbi:MAG TPA: universal stress protein [Tepidiformaceae bacterium]|nr:universal stress protein [Tepidiformaceae bacterium]
MRIVVPLDQSPVAEQSLPWAAALAMALGAPVHLVSVYRSDEDFWAYSDLDPGKPIREGSETIPAYLDAVARSAPLAGVKVTTEVRTGDVPEQIVAAASEGDTKLVVITTRGRGGFTGRGFGSVADKLVRSLRQPVLVVNPDGGAVSFDRILVPVAGSTESEAALGLARDVAGATGGVLHLLRVIEPDTDWAIRDEEYDAYVDQVTDRATRYVQRLAREGDMSVVLHGRPEAIIPEYARGNRCALIVMATHGWSGAIRLEMGSVADAVVRSGEVPVMLVRVPVE